MSFYRSILAVVAAVALAAPVFANDAAPSSTDPQTTAMATETKININKATAKDLMKIKGLNAAKARAIVAYRNKHGDFKTLDDLSHVKGFKKVKPETMKEIQAQLTVE